MWDFIIKYWVEWAFGIIVTAGGFVLKRFWKRQKAIEDGVRDILRMQILDKGEQCIKDGKITVSQKDAIDSAYNSYHALGGNGTITRVHQEIMELPLY